jgi:hypothetical protein
MIKCIKDFTGDAGDFRNGQIYITSTDIEKELVDSGIALFYDAIETASVTPRKRKVVEIVSADYT